MTYCDKNFESFCSQPHQQHVMIGVELKVRMNQQAYQPKGMQDKIILDTGSTLHLYCNASLCENIRPTKQVISMITNN